MPTSGNVKLIYLEPGKKTLGHRQNSGLPKYRGANMRGKLASLRRRRLIPEKIPIFLDGENYIVL